MLECLYSRYILKANGDALHWKKVYEVNIVSLVERKAVNNIVDEPQNQRVWMKEHRDVEQAGRWVMLYIVMFILFI